MAIERFRDAQNAPSSGFEDALAELRSGGKRSHWIWYVFPQLDGLGSSGASRQFALRGKDESEEFLRDAELRGRLLTITDVVAEQLTTGGPHGLRALMGSDVDARKLVSSLTLFRRVAEDLHAREPGVKDYSRLARTCDAVLAIAARQGYPPCAFTLARLRD